MGKRRLVPYKRMVLEYADLIGKNVKSYREFGIAKSTFYEWSRAYRENGLNGLIPKKPIARHHPRALSPEIIERILELRRTYCLGPQRIAWYLERYHGIKVSCASVYRTLVRTGERHLPRHAGRRAVHTHRYAKEVPGHHVQADVKILSLKDPDGHRVRRFQYTAIDDATRVRALKIYNRHNQRSAIAFIDYVIEKFPFRIHTLRTDRGHEFQAQFHWHVEDKGIRHVYIRPRSPELNGKVERSHRSDQEEFYQLLTYKDDVDLNKKLEEWERYYNYDRPHGAFKGKTPYEVLRSLLR
jgi:transposase InsO family protein